jgi:hypothetical protein
MRRWMQVGTAAAGGVAASTLAAAAIGAARWNRATARTVDRLMTPHRRLCHRSEENRCLRA